MEVNGNNTAEKTTSSLLSCLFLHGNYGTKFMIDTYINPIMMKIKTGITLITALFISDYVFSQDTSLNQKLSENETYHIAPTNNNQISQPQDQIHRDSRSGSSSPMYNTYQKNNNGAGAITTNPNKGSGSTFTSSFNLDSTQKSPVYHDTRLGSSSPLYNTYQKNNYGAGAITTNPNKGSGGGNFTPSPTAQVNEAPIDTTSTNNTTQPDTLYHKNDSGSVPTDSNK